MALFTRDAIDIPLAGLKNYADIKIQQLRGPVAEAKAGLDQAQASEQAAFQAQLHFRRQVARILAVRFLDV